MKVKAVYTEYDPNMCDKCVYGINDFCPREGFCKCDEYRCDNNTNTEGDYYFVLDDD